MNPRYFLVVGAVALGAAFTWTARHAAQADPFADGELLRWEGFLEYQGRPFNGAVPITVRVAGPSGQDFFQHFNQVQVFGGHFALDIGCRGTQCAPNEQLPAWALGQRGVRIEATVAGDVLAEAHLVGAVPGAQVSDRFGQLQVSGDVTINGDLTAPQIQTGAVTALGSVDVEGAFDVGGAGVASGAAALTIGGQLRMPALGLTAQNLALAGGTLRIRSTQPDTPIRLAFGATPEAAQTHAIFSPTRSSMSGSLTTATFNLYEGVAERLSIGPNGNGASQIRIHSGPITLGTSGATNTIDPRISVQFTQGIPGISSETFNPSFGSTFGNVSQQVCFLSRYDVKPNEIGGGRMDGNSAGRPWACELTTSGNGYVINRFATGDRNAVQGCSATCIRLPGTVQYQ